MKKKAIILITAVSMLLSGCSSPEIDIVINADGYEGILLATENTAAPPVSIPISNMGNYSTETASGGSDAEPAENTAETDEASETTEQEEAPVTADVPLVPVTPAPEPEVTIVDPVETTTTTTAYVEITTTTTDTEATAASEDPPNGDLTPIIGQRIATVEQMRAFIKAINPEVDQKIIDMIPYYLSEGEAEGVRGDIAFAQSCVETGYVRFEKAGTASAVTIYDINFCGLGPTQ